MAINETISKGNKYRRLKDNVNKVWQRISFWTAASDVEFDNGQTAQEALGNITGITDSLTSNSSAVAASANAVSQLNSKITSFQTGVDALYNKFVSKGVTPESKTLTAMSNATDTVYNTGYNTGYNAGYAVGPSQYNKSFSIPLSLVVKDTGNDTVTSLSAEGTLYFNPYTNAKSGVFTLAGHGKYWDANGGKWVHTNASKQVRI